MNMYSIESLEAVRAAVQVPEDCKTGIIGTTGRAPQDLGSFDGPLDERETRSHPLADDLELTESLITGINASHDNVYIPPEATIMHGEWLASRHKASVAAARYMAVLYIRASRRDAVDLTLVDAEQATQQIVAQYLTSHAIVHSLISTGLNANPAIYYNPNEIAALREEFSPAHVSPTNFWQSLSLVALRKHRARGLLALQYDNPNIKPVDAGAVYRELVLPPA